MTPDSMCALVWGDEPAPKDEGRKTPGGEGWLSWNGKAAEFEFCEFAGSLVLLFRPERIIETGVGGGFTTRRILTAVRLVGSTFVAFEADEVFRDATARFAWPDLDLSRLPTPTPNQIAAADLLVLDSGGGFRRDEFLTWVEDGKPGSYCLMHDVDPAREAGTVQETLGRLVAEAGIPGVLLSNPRGGWLGRHP